VDELFRDLHTLKGSSAFAGLRKMNRVAHRAEDLIGELREGKRSCDRALIDVLLETLDVLRAIVDRARRGAAIDVDVTDLLRRLKSPHAAPQVSSIKPRAVQQTQAETVESAGIASPSAATGGQSTLRIEFEKVDRLLNLVGEIVLARGKLTTTNETQSGLMREVSNLRKKLHTLLGNPAMAAAAAASNVNSRAVPRSTSSALLEDLERTERVLRETFGEMDLGINGLTLAVGQLRDTVMKLRMVPIARLFTKYQRTVRELSNKLGKDARVELFGADTELDKVLVERLEDPLLHLVRNAIDHGLEPPLEREAAGKSRTGEVRLSASQRGGQILVSIEDDGRGLDPEKLKRKAVAKGLLGEAEASALSDEESFDLIFHAGFSTKDAVSDVSGRGVGMDVVRDAIQKLKGTIQIRSEVGKGTRIELALPLTLAITQVLTARVGGELVAIPLDAVVSAQTLQPGQLERVATGLCIRIADGLVPVVDLGEVLGLGASVGLEELSERNVVIVSLGTTELGLIVQQVLGRHEVVIKSLGSMLAQAPCAAGAAVVGERMVLVVDLADVAARAHAPSVASAQKTRARPRAKGRARILVAEDSPTIAEAIRRELTQAGFEVTIAEDGERALELAREQLFDAVSTDVMMPRRDGYELTRALRADPRYRDVPIIMVTSKDARIDAVRGYDAGANAYITKPADVDELIRALESLLHKRGT
jgi:chemotaxis protein histidine kinase CheA/ActR/RegA family two-component response regulator